MVLASLTGLTLPFLLILMLATRSAMDVRLCHDVLHHHHTPFQGRV